MRNKLFRFCRTLMCVQVYLVKVLHSKYLIIQKMLNKQFICKLDLILYLLFRISQKEIVVELKVPIMMLPRRLVSILLSLDSSI